MKRINWMIATAATVVALVAPSAEATIFTDSYEADALPTASTPAWTEFFNQGTESVAGGILTLSTAAGDDNLYRLGGGTGLDWDPTGAGSTLEIRLKVDSQLGATGAGDFGILTGAKVWKFSFATNQINEVVAGGTVSMDTSAAFHVYRFTVAGTGGPLNLYVDGGGSPVATFAGGATGSNRLDWGDDLGADAGQVQWDYIRWTNLGAFAPVPEPSVVWLAAVGLMTLIRARRAGRN